MLKRSDGGKADGNTVTWNRKEWEQQCFGCYLCSLCFERQVMGCLGGDDSKASRRNWLAARCLGECWERRTRSGKHGHAQEWGPSPRIKVETEEQHPEDRTSGKSSCEEASRGARATKSSEAGEQNWGKELWLRGGGALRIMAPLPKSHPVIFTVGSAESGQVCEGTHDPKSL